jgi:glutathione S-transferase
MRADVPILHHYELSPFSEKVRKVFGYKGLAWASVLTPPVLPKPDLLPLSGGYRKAPVMQLGRDVYCDTKLICRVLDRLRPSPPLIPPGTEASTLMIERWVDQTMFFTIVMLVLQPQALAALASAMPAGFLDVFIKDRMAMFAQGGTLQRPAMETVRAELPGMLGSLEAQLAARPFLTGEAPTQIDFAIYHTIWFALGNAVVRSEIEPYPKLMAWAARILAIGEGQRTEIEGAAAIELCRATSAEQAPLPGAPLSLPQARLGDRVRIGASDYAPDQVEGELVIANAFELAVRRTDPRAGTVVVHFPAEGFTLAKVG